MLLLNRVFLPALLALQLSPQDREKDERRDLILKLGSESVAERLEAATELKAIGPSVIPALRREIPNLNKEGALQAKRVIGTITLMGRLTPNLLKAFPGIEDTLYASDDETWTKVFLRCTERSEELHLTAMDLAPLWIRAVKGASTLTERMTVCLSCPRGVHSEVSSFLEYLNDPDALVRQAVATSLLSFGEEQDLKVLEKIVESEDSHIQRKAGQILGGIGRQHGLFLDDHFASRHSQTRKMALWAAMNSAKGARTQNILMELKSNIPDIRRAAVSLLRQLDVRAAVQDLVGVLEDSHDGVRVEALLALGTLAPTRESETLAPLLRDDNEAIRSACATALGHLRATHLGPQIVQLLKDNSAIVRASAAESLGSLGYSEAIPELVLLIGDSDPLVRAKSIGALGTLNATQVKSQIARALSDSNDAVRISALRTLGVLSATSAIPEIKKIVTEMDRSVRLAAGAALCQLNEHTGIRVLLDNEGNLSEVNALSRPKEYRHLRMTRFVGSLTGSRMDVLDRLNKATSLEVELPQDMSKKDRIWWSQQQYHSNPAVGMTLLSCFELLMGRVYTLVLEEKRIRIVRYPEAVSMLNEKIKDNSNTPSAATLKATLQAHDGLIVSIAFSPNGRFVASGGWAKKIRIWDITEASEFLNSPAPNGACLALAYSPDGTVLALGSTDHTVRLINIQNKTELAILKGHTGTVQSLAFTSSGETLASGGGDGTVRLWDARNGASRDILRILAGGGIQSTRFSPDGSMIAGGGQDGTVHIWKTKNGTKSFTLKVPLKDASCVGFSPNGEFLAASDRQMGAVVLWDPSTGKELRRITWQGGGAQAMAISPDGKVIVTGGVDGKIRVWDAMNGSEIASLSIKGGPITTIGISPSGETLVAATGGKLHVWGLTRTLRK